MNILILPLLMGALFVLIGVLSEEYPQLIAGYNETDSSSESKFLKILKRALSSTGFIIILGCATSIYFKWGVFYWVFLIAPALIIPLYIMHKSHSSKATLAFWLAIIISVMSFIYYASKKPMVETDGKRISISGLYGGSIPVDEIRSVDLLESIPQVGLEKNSFAMGQIRKGNFLVENMGKTTLFLRSAKGPFLKIQTAANCWLINYQDATETLATYRKIARVTP